MECHKGFERCSHETIKKANKLISTSIKTHMFVHSFIFFGGRGGGGEDIYLGFILYPELRVLMHNVAPQNLLLEAIHRSRIGHR